jgi:hypothetical protein
VREVMPISLTRRFVYLLVLVAILLVGAVTVSLVTSSNRSHVISLAYSGQGITDLYAARL